MPSFKLDEFGGGILSRIDATKIPGNNAVLLDNADISSTVLKSAKGLKVLDPYPSELLNGFFYKYKGSYIDDLEETYFVEYEGNLYYFGANHGRGKIYNGTSIHDIGIQFPDTEIISADAAITSGSVELERPITRFSKYLVTAYDSSTGLESSPSEDFVVPWTSIVGYSNYLRVSSVTFTVVFTAVDTRITDYRFYRLGGSLSSYTLVATVPKSGAVTFVDTKSGVDLEGDLLGIFDLELPLPGFSSVVEAYGILFAAYLTTVRYSRIGEPQYWPTNSSLPVRDTVTGLLPIPQGLLVFTKSKTYILLGTTGETFSLLLVSSSVGCTNAASCKLIKNSPLWVSGEGISTFVRGSVESISKAHIGTVALDVINTLVLDEQYYILKADRTLLVLDFRFGLRFFTYSYQFGIAGIGFDGTKLIVLQYTTATRESPPLITEAYKGEDLPLTYLSPIYTGESSARLKTFTDVYINSIGDLSVQGIVQYIDLPFAWECSSLKPVVHYFQVPNTYQTGSSMQFKVSGTGTLFCITTRFTVSEDMDTAKGADATS